MNKLLWNVRFTAVASFEHPDDLPAKRSEHVISVCQDTRAEGRKTPSITGWPGAKANRVKYQDDPGSPSVDDKGRLSCEVMTESGDAAVVSSRASPRETLLTSTREESLNQQ